MNRDRCSVELSMIEEELNDKDDSDQLGIICSRSRSDDLGVVETDISLFSWGDHDTDPCPLDVHLRGFRGT